MDGTNFGRFGIGDHDVPPSASNEGLDGEGYRAFAQRGFHLAEPVPGIERAFEEFEWGAVEY